MGLLAPLFQSKPVFFLGIEDRTFKYRVHSAGTSQNVLKMRIAACYVLFKNFELARFNPHELKEQIKRLKDLVGYIVMALYEQIEIPKIRYYLRLLKTLPGNNVKYTIAELPLLLLKGKSKRITNFFIYH